MSTTDGGKPPGYNSSTTDKEASIAEQFDCIEAMAPSDLPGGTPLGEWAAARIGDLETENQQQADRIKALEDALKFYADLDNYYPVLYSGDVDDLGPSDVAEDLGIKARAALGGGA